MNLLCEPGNTSPGYVPWTQPVNTLAKEVLLKCEITGEIRNQNGKSNYLIFLA